MKKYLLIPLLSLMVLSGCGGRRQSDDACFYCSNLPAYNYDIDGNTMSLCDECYEKEMQQRAQDLENLKD